VLLSVRTLVLLSGGGGRVTSCANQSNVSPLGAAADTDQRGPPPAAPVKRPGDITIPES